ncbi:MAG TPA: acyl-CoA dehydrogenase family protein [Caulobacteraceae bacterium]|nr:acyl-CoA dehydrogenase family protein [Caulobacteraceae bacterium]
MDFALSQDQKLMQASLAGTLDRASPLERVRAFAEIREPVARDVWGALTELGVPGLLIPEEHGGLGLGLLDAALVAETLGAHVAPTPFLGSAVLAPLAILAAGSPAQQQAWLPRLAAGEKLAGAAITETVSGGRDGAGIGAAAGKLSGKALFALDAAAADVILVADTAGGLWLVAGDAPGLTRVPLTTIDLTRSVSELRFERTPAEALVAGDAATTLTRLRDAAWTMTAADMLGAAGVMLDKAVAYAKERRQFGRLIGSFQAVKHLCAEMAAELEPCRALVWYAAYAQDAVPAEASLTAAHAKAHLSEVSRFVARTATEVHGGMGITDLLGLHYWFKRVGLDRQLFGGPERVRHLAAAIQGLAA